MRAFLIALAACLILAAPASAQSTTLVINEVDYDQPGTDTAEFVEIKNVSVAAINLDAYQLRFVNGAERNDLPDRRPARPSSSPAATTSSSAANAATTPNCDLDVAPDDEPDPERQRRTASLLETAAGRGRWPRLCRPATRWPASLRARHATSEVAANAGRGHRARCRTAATPTTTRTTSSAPRSPGRLERRHAVRRPAGRRRAVGHRHDARRRRHPRRARRRTSTITFSEPVDVTADAVTIACSDSGAHPATLSGGPTTFTLDPDGRLRPQRDLHGHRLGRRRQRPGHRRPAEQPGGRLHLLVQHPRPGRPAHPRHPGRAAHLAP